jgi:hypothetical protein
VPYSRNLGDSSRFVNEAPFGFLAAISTGPPRDALQFFVPEPLAIAAA